MGSRTVVGKPDSGQINLVGASAPKAALPNQGRLGKLLKTFNRFAVADAHFPRKLFAGEDDVNLTCVIDPTVHTR